MQRSNQVQCTARLFLWLSSCRELIVYGIIGLAGTAAHYVILVGLVELTKVAYVVASSMGFVVGAIVNHELNRSVLFRKTRRTYAGSGVRFLATACFGFLINLMAMMLFIRWGGLHYIAAQLVTTSVVFSLTYAINKHWTFAN